MKKRILVFPCGSEIGLEINRSLAGSAHFELYGGSSVPDHGRYVYSNYIEGIPFVEDPHFVDSINAIIVRYGIDYIFPAHDSVVLKLAENSNLLIADVVTSTAETCEVCRSKKKTYEMFKTILSVPMIYDPDACYDFPVFLKPDVGQGSKGTFKALTSKDMFYHLEKDDSLLVLEYLPGTEYTIDCFTNSRGELLFAEGRERSRISNGISVNSRMVYKKEFKEIAFKINEKLNMKGVWFFQLKERASGELVLLEIAPRVAGTMALARTAGVNLVLLSLYDRMGLDVKILKNNLLIEIDRALFARYRTDCEYAVVYVDFDDTLIVDKKVNTQLLSFLYQAKSENKRIVLLTRHTEDIYSALKKYCICESLFEKIVVLNNSERKSTLIDVENAIFIDDSFAEREEVQRSKGIPVFGIDAIESLLDWRT